MRRGEGREAPQPTRHLRASPALPYVALVVVTILIVASLPTSQALWARVLLISASIEIAEFTPTPTPTPEGGGGGCTPGFWKQEHHFDQWPDPYTPDSLLETVFSVNDIDGASTMLEGLEAKGGGLNALLRHAVAALLNAAHPAVDFAMNVDQVVELFQQALANGEFEATKDRFEAANERDCPLPLDPGHDVGPAILQVVAPTPSATPASTGSSTAVLSPTATSEASATPEPTASPQPTTAQATDSPTPSNTARPTDSGPASPTPTATPTP